ncbi:polysaccharide deacetylase family protein [bacterium]|nr:polysaccharide deacetylase family protein [bacterium]
MKKTVPVIISGDIDPSPEAAYDERKKAFDWTTGLLERYGCKATFFCVGEVARRLAGPVRELAERGHEVGCHGLSHDESDEYNRLSGPETLRRLTAATAMISDVTGRPVLSFRGPRVKTSAVTQKILVDLGYRVDSSVCSQRLDFISSNMINPGWLTAPRRPYHPSLRSPYRRGTSPLLVIPVSALGLPFVSGLLYTFGRSVTTLLFDLLYHESRRTGKPIVYLLHPGEFALKTGDKRRDFSVRVEGMKLRRSPMIFEQDVIRRYDLHVELLEHIVSRGDIRFMTMLEYAEEYGDSHG